MKILVVDDEKLLVKGIKFNLENEGYTVDAAYNGEDAVAMARSGAYDLIILDLMMPGKDGLQSAQEIVSYLRKEKISTNLVPIDSIVDFHFPETTTPLDSIISNEEVTALHEAIDELPPKCKHVFFLAKIEKLPYAQIAKVLDLSLATVNYHIGAAMNALRKKMSQG